jgi:hypothetical protein
VPPAQNPAAADAADALMALMALMALLPLPLIPLMPPPSSLLLRGVAVVELWGPAPPTPILE